MWDGHLKFPEFKEARDIDIYTLTMKDGHSIVMFTVHTNENAFVASL